jgi:hypothetical protein
MYKGKQMARFCPGLVPSSLALFVATVQLFTLLVIQSVPDGIRFNLALFGQAIVLLTLGTRQIYPDKSGPPARIAVLPTGVGVMPEMRVYQEWLYGESQCGRRPHLLCQMGVIKRVEGLSFYQAGATRQ